MSERIRYADAVSLYPDAVDFIVYKVRRSSRSKFKNDDPSTWAWSRGYAVTVGEAGQKCTTLDGILTRLAREKRRRGAMTVDERVDDQLRRTDAHLRALNQWAAIPPGYLRERWLEAEREQEAERQRFAAMTTGERDASLGDALATLRHGSGFVEIAISRPAR